MLLLNWDTTDKVTLLLHFSILMSSISLNKMLALIKNGAPDEFKNHHNVTECIVIADPSCTCKLV